MSMFSSVRNENNSVFLSSGHVKLTTDNCVHINRWLIQNPRVQSVLMCLDCGSLFLNNVTFKPSKFSFISNYNYWDALACCFLSSLKGRHAVVFSSLFSNTFRSFAADLALEGYFASVPTSSHLLQCMFHPSNKARRKPKIKLLQNFCPDAVIVTDNSKYLCIPVVINSSKDINVEKEVENLTDSSLKASVPNRKTLESDEADTEAPVMESQSSVVNSGINIMENISRPEELQATVKKAVKSNTFSQIRTVISKSSLETNDKTDVGDETVITSSDTNTVITNLATAFQTHISEQINNKPNTEVPNVSWTNVTDENISHADFTLCTDVDLPTDGEKPYGDHTLDTNLENETTNNGADEMVERSLVLSEARSMKQAKKSVTVVSSSSSQNVSVKTFTSQSQIQSHVSGAISVSKTLQEQGMFSEVTENENGKEEVSQETHVKSVISQSSNVSDGANVTSNFKQITSKFDSEKVGDISYTSHHVESVGIPLEKSTQNAEDHEKITGKHKKSKNKNKKSQKATPIEKQTGRKIPDSCGVSDQMDKQITPIENMGYKVFEEDLDEIEKNSENQSNKSFTSSESSVTSRTICKKERKICRAVTTKTSSNSFKMAQKESDSNDVDESELGNVSENSKIDSVVQILDKRALEISKAGSIDVENKVIVSHQEDNEGSDQEVGGTNQLDLICPSKHTYVTSEGHITTKQIKTVRVTVKGVRIISEEKKLLGLSLPKSIKVPGSETQNNATRLLEEESSSTSSFDKQIQYKEKEPDKFDAHIHEIQNKIVSQSSASNIEDISLLSQVPDKTDTENISVQTANIAKETSDDQVNIKKSVSYNRDKENVISSVSSQNILECDSMKFPESYSRSALNKPENEISLDKSVVKDEELPVELEVAFNVSGSLNQCDTLKSDGEKQYVITIDAVSTGKKSPFMQFQQEKRLAEVSKPVQVSCDVSYDQSAEISTLDSKIKSDDTNIISEKIQTQHLKETYITNISKEQKFNPSYHSDYTENMFQSDNIEENVIEYSKSFPSPSEVKDSTDEKSLSDGKNIISSPNIEDECTEVQSSCEDKIASESQIDLLQAVKQVNSTIAIHDKDTEMLLSTKSTLSRDYIEKDNSKTKDPKISEIFSEKTDDFDDFEPESVSQIASVSSEYETVKSIENEASGASFSSSVDLIKPISETIGKKSKKPKKKKKKSNLKNLEILKASENSESNSKLPIPMQSDALVAELCVKYETDVSTVKQDSVEIGSVIPEKDSQLISIINSNMEGKRLDICDHVTEDMSSVSEVERSEDKIDIVNVPYEKLLEGEETSGKKAVSKKNQKLKKSKQKKAADEKIDPNKSQMAKATEVSENETPNKKVIDNTDPKLPLQIESMKLDGNSLLVESKTRDTTSTIKDFNEEKTEILMENFSLEEADQLSSISETANNSNQCVQSIEQISTDLNSAEIDYPSAAPTEEFPVDVKKETEMLSAVSGEFSIIEPLLENLPVHKNIENVSTSTTEAFPCDTTIPTENDIINLFDKETSINQENLLSKSKKSRKKKKKVTFDCDRFSELRKSTENDKTSEIKGTVSIDESTDLITDKSNKQLKQPHEFDDKDEMQKNSLDLQDKQSSDDKGILHSQEDNFSPIDSKFLTESHFLITEKLQTSVTEVCHDSSDQTYDSRLETSDVEKPDDLTSSSEAVDLSKSKKKRNRKKKKKPCTVSDISSIIFEKSVPEKLSDSVCDSDSLLKDKEPSAETHELFSALQVNDQNSGTEIPTKNENYEILEQEAEKVKFAVEDNKGSVKSEESTTVLGTDNMEVQQMENIKIISKSQSEISIKLSESMDIDTSIEKTHSREIFTNDCENIQFLENDDMQVRTVDKQDTGIQKNYTDQEVVSIAHEVVSKVLERVPEAFREISGLQGNLSLSTDLKEQRLEELPELESPIEFLDPEMTDQQEKISVILPKSTNSSDLSKSFENGLETINRTNAVHIMEVLKDESSEQGLQTPVVDLSIRDEIVGSEQKNIINKGFCGDISENEPMNLDVKSYEAPIKLSLVSEMNECLNQVKAIEDIKKVNTCKNSENRDKETTSEDNSKFPLLVEENSEEHNIPSLPLENIEAFSNVTISTPEKDVGKEISISEAVMMTPEISKISSTCSITNQSELICIKEKDDNMSDDGEKLETSEARNQKMLGEVLLDQNTESRYLGLEVDSRELDVVDFDNLEETVTSVREQDSNSENKSDDSFIKLSHEIKRTTVKLECHDQENKVVSEEVPSLLEEVADDLPTSSIIRESVEKAFNGSLKNSLQDNVSITLIHDIKDNKTSNIYQDYRDVYEAHSLEELKQETPNIETGLQIGIPDEQPEIHEKDNELISEKQNDVQTSVTSDDLLEEEEELSVTDSINVSLGDTSLDVSLCSEVVSLNKEIRENNEFESIGHISDQGKQPVIADTLSASQSDVSFEFPITTTVLENKSVCAVETTKILETKSAQMSDQVITKFASEPDSSDKLLHSVEEIFFEPNENLETNDKISVRSDSESEIVSMQQVTVSNQISIQGNHTEKEVTAVAQKIVSEVLKKLPDALKEMTTVQRDISVNTNATQDESIAKKISDAKAPISCDSIMDQEINSKTLDPRELEKATDVLADTYIETRESEIVSLEEEIIEPKEQNKTKLEVNDTVYVLSDCLSTLVEDISDSVQLQTLTEKKLVNIDEQNIELHEPELLGKRSVICHYDTGKLPIYTEVTHPQRNIQEITSDDEASKKLLSEEREFISHERENVADSNIKEQKILEEVSVITNTVVVSACDSSSPLSLQGEKTDNLEEIFSSAGNEEDTSLELDKFAKATGKEEVSSEIKESMYSNDVPFVVDSGELCSRVSDNTTTPENIPIELQQSLDKIPTDSNKITDNQKENILCRVGILEESITHISKLEGSSSDITEVCQDLSLDLPNQNETDYATTIKEFPQDFGVESPKSQMDLVEENISSVETFVQSENIPDTIELEMKKYYTKGKPSHLSEEIPQLVRQTSSIQTETTTLENTQIIPVESEKSPDTYDIVRDEQVCSQDAVSVLETSSQIVQISELVRPVCESDTLFDDLPEQANLVRNAVETETKFVPVVDTELDSTNDAVQSCNMLMDKNMNEMTNMLKDLVSYKEIARIHLSCNISTITLENHLKLLQQLESEVSFLKSKLEEMESSYKCLPYSVSKTTEKKFNLLYQQTVDQIEVINETLLIQIKEVHTLLLKSSNYKTPEEVMQHSNLQLETLNQAQYLDNLICDQEDLLMLIHQYFQICHGTSNVIEERNNMPFSSFAATLKRLYCMNKLKNLPSNQDFFKSEMTFQANYVSSLPVTCFLPNVEFEKIIFEQRLEDICCALNEFVTGAKKLEQTDNVEYYYIQLVQTICQWIEFIEHWILKVKVLSVDQHAEQYQLIEKELTVIQQHLIKINELTREITPTLSEQVKNNILFSLTDLQHQIDSTKRLASDYFNQISVGIQEHSRIDNDIKSLDSKVSSYMAKLEDIECAKTVEVSEVKPLKLELVKCCNKYENLSSEKLKLSLKWPCCVVENTDDTLKLNHNTKIKAYKVYEKALYAEKGKGNYNFSFESLKKLCDILESFFQLNLCIPDPTELENISTTVKQALIFLDILAFRCEENFSLCNSFLKTEDVTNFSALMSRSNDLYICGKDKIKMWNICHMYIKELDRLTHFSQVWLKQKYENSKDHPCPEKDLPNYIVFLKDLQHEIKDHLHQIKRIVDLKNKVSGIVSYPSLSNFIDDLVTNYQEFNENIDSRVGNVSLFSKQWSQFELDLKALQKWLSVTESRLKHLQHQIKTNDDLPTLFENIRSILRVESETECKKELFEQVRNAIEQSITLNIFQESGVIILNSITEQWNELVQNITTIKGRLFNNLNCTEVLKQLNLWLADIQNAYETHPIQNVNSISDLQQLKSELWCWKKNITVMESMCKSPGTEEAENESLFVDQLQALKFKLIFHLEKVQFIIKKSLEFDDLSTYLLHMYEIMQARLTKISESNLNKNHYALLNNLDEIQKYKVELNDSERKYDSMKQMIPVLCENTDIDNIRNNVLSKYKTLEQYHTSIHSTIASVEEDAKMNTKLCNKYHNDFNSYHQYIIEQETIISLFAGSILNLHHLNKKTSQLKDAFQEFLNNEKLVEDVLASSQLVKECSDAGVHLELESDIDVLKNKWEFLKSCFCDLVESQSTLTTEWQMYSANCNSLSELITNLQASLMNLHLDKKYTLEEYNKCLDIFNKKLCLSSLKDSAEKLCSNSNLHQLAKKNVEVSFNSLGTSVQSLNKAIMYYQRNIPYLLENEHHKEQIKSIQTSLNNLNMALCDEVPSEKQDLDTSLSYTEKLLQDISQHYACLLYIKEILIFQEISDFATVDSIAFNLLRIQEMTSKLLNYYLKLMEAFAKNNTSLENCMLLLQLLRKLKNLHAVEIPSDYQSLMAYFLKAQIMEIYIHSHQIVMQHIIDSDTLSSSLSSRFGGQNLYNAFSQYVKEWNSLENSYRNKMTVIKERICLWQNYLYHIYKIRSSLKTIRKEIAESTLLSNTHELKEELACILKLESNLNNDLKAMNLVQKTADELQEVLKNPDIKKSIQNEISDLKKQIESELEALVSRKSELNEIEVAFCDLTSHLETSREKLSSIQLYLTRNIPSSLEEIKKELERAEVEDVAIKEAIELLNSVNVDKLKNEGRYFQNITDQKVACQNFGRMIYCGYMQHTFLLRKNLDKLSVFKKKYAFLIKWCEKIERKINQEFLNFPSNAKNKLNIIQEEINLMQPEFDNVISLGNKLSSDKEILPKMSEKVSHLSSTFSHLANLHAQRLESVKRISDYIDNLSENSRKLNSFMAVAENSLELSSNIKDLPFEEIEKKLNIIKDLEKEINMYDEISSNSETLLKEMDSCADSFKSIFIRNALQYSQSVLLRWTVFKTVISKQRLSLQQARCTWDEFLIALKKLEEWLISKESIASKVNYCDPGHSRNTYLEGIDVFEKLNHCFQDDIQVLHSVNSCFHIISKKDFNISSSLKDRVLTANDHWHRLYQRVIEVFESIKNILQIWDDFDQLKEHLLLFLTEADIKLTKMETTCPFPESSYEIIEDDFKLHADEKERFKATAKHLMKQSECSICIIQASVDEVESYWEELYKRILSQKKVHVDALKKEEITHQYSENEDVKLNVSNEESNKKYKEGISTVDESDSQSHLPESKIKISSSEHQHIESQTYSNVVAMGSKKMDDNKVETEYIATKTVTGSTTKKVHKSQSEKQIAIHSTRSKQTSFDDECTKDLLAALKEAEERMDSLEKVLSEITPSGIDERGPNYSHLLAACRSSVDVIQHLSQFLFYDVQHESDRPERVEIKLQSEDLLQRWQKIEDLTLSKESRVLDNKKSWENFSKELKGFETWLQKTLQDYNSESCTDTDMEKLVTLLQRHKELISQIRAQKKIILTLNLTGQKFLSASSDSVKTSSLKQRIKTVNDHWDKLYSTALQWQNKLQSEFLQSSEFRSTLEEMKLWLEESEKRIDEMSRIKERDDAVLHEQHTELFALKQQLEVYCNRLETLLEITLHLFLPEHNYDENPALSEETLKELQTELKSYLKLSQSLLIKCTEMLKNVSSLLGFSKFREHLSQSQNEASSLSQADGSSTDKSECCSFLMRVARASFPIQAILLLLLGAAILLPMEEEEELSCRLSNNFASSLNTMLRYPDGPPPV